MSVWRPHPCGHFTRTTGCGGCDPGAGWTFDAQGRVIVDEAAVRRVFPPLSWQRRAWLTFLNWRLRWLLRWDELRGRR